LIFETGLTTRLLQIGPGVNAGPMTIAPIKLDGVSADSLYLVDGETSGGRVSQQV